MIWLARKGSELQEKYLVKNTLENISIYSTQFHQ